MNIEEMKHLCSLPPDKVIMEMGIFLKDNGYKVRYFKDKYLIATGTVPVALVAHVDTVFDNEIMRNKYGLEWIHDQEAHVLWSPDGAGFDDRAGIYAIKQIVNAGFHPHIILTCGEEIGGLGAYQLIGVNKKPPFDCKFVIELDRMGYDDSVYYDCENQDFEEYINSFGFHTRFGSFTDISIICPAWKIAGVNLSVGYIDEHSKIERLYYDVLSNTIVKVEDILADVMVKTCQRKFKYIPSKHSFNAFNLELPIEGV